MSKATTFRYQLESLLKKRRLDHEQALSVYLEAQDVYNRRKQDCDDTNLRIIRAEQWIRLANECGQIIDAEEVTRMKSYLSVCRDEAVEQGKLLKSADHALKSAVESVNSHRESIKTLEKHREGQQAEHQSDQARVSAKNADELWLIRNHTTTRSISRIRKGS